MISTLTPTCSICGLRFENRPILELHIREDHPQHRASTEPGHGTPADAPASQPLLRSPASSQRERAAASRTKAATTKASSRRARRLHTGWARTGLRRVTGVFRRANAELLLASEIMLRPADAPRPRQPADPPAVPDAHQEATGGQGDRAA